MNIFSKAHAGLNLTPGQRAFLRLVEGFAIAGLVAALPVAAQLLNAQTVDWAFVGRTALGTFAVAVLMAAVKYLKAQGDTPLIEQPAAAALAGVAKQVASAAGVSYPDTTAIAVATATVPPEPTDPEPLPVPVADVLSGGASGE